MVRKGTFLAKWKAPLGYMDLVAYFVSHQFLPGACLQIIYIVSSMFMALADAISVIKRYH